MKPEVLHRVTVRDVAAALPTHDHLDMVQHHVSRTEMRRYIALTDRQWWDLVGFLREREHEQVASHSDGRDMKTRNGPN